MLESNQLLLYSSSRALVKSHHHLDLCFGILDSPSFLHEPYLETMITFQKSISGASNFHFPNKALLNKSVYFIPSPPSVVDLQILSHLIQAIFLPSAPQLHMKLRCSFVIFLQIEDGALKKDRKHRDIAFKTELIKHTQPTKDIFLPFHVDNLFLIFDSCDIFELF